jgi:predicted transcriptional regulator
VNPPIIAKAKNPKDESEAIVVSFDARWLEAIRSKQFSSALRKRVPQSFRPRWMYIYVNSPASVILARASVVNISSVPLVEALAHQQELCLSEKEIERYSAGAKAVGLYKLGSIELARTHLTLTWLRQHMVFHPPQSFFALKDEAKTIIDRSPGFSRPEQVR